VRWVRDPSLPIRRRPANEHRDGAVVGQFDVREVAPVVVQKACEAHRTEGRRDRRVDVPHAAVIGHPGDAVGFSRGRHLERRRRTQVLRDRRLPVRGGARRALRVEGDGRTEERRDNETCERGARHEDSGDGRRAIGDPGSATIRPVERANSALTVTVTDTSHAMRSMSKVQPVEVESAR
jgi:hypothetical protein